MPQPTMQSVHINSALTEIATAYLQADDAYIADTVFPKVPVQHRSDVFFKYRKGDFFRDDFQKRADGAESAGSGWNMDQSSPYQADVWALHKDIGPQAKANADPAVDLDVAATKFLMQKGKIRRDRIFAGKFMTTSVWGTDVTGTSSGTPGSATPAYWNDDANGDPFTDISVWQDTVLQNTGMEPNVLVLSRPAYSALRKHPLVIDRIKYTSPAYAGKITPQLLAEAFDVEKVVVSKAVYNSAQEGASDSFNFVVGKHALLCYAAPEPGLMVPSAGYTFPWIGLLDGLGGPEGVAIGQIDMPWLGLGTVRTEAQMAFDMQVVGSDLGVFFSGIVS
jgi:hypothetical protein